MSKISHRAYLTALAIPFFAGCSADVNSAAPAAVPTPTSNSTPTFSLTADSLSLESPGDSARLRALDNGISVEGSTITWKSLNPDVAVVSRSGSVIACGAGLALIVASHGALMDSVVVHVTRAAKTTSVIAPAVRLLSADTVRLPFKGKFNFALTSAGTPPIRYVASTGSVTTAGVYSAPSKATTARIIATDANGSADTSFAIVSATKFGVASDITWSKDAGFRRARIAQLASSHTQVARVELLWSFIEWTKGRPDWTVPDSVVNGLVAAGIEPLFVIDGSPPWANGVGENVDGYYLFVPTTDAAFKTWVTSYAAFMKQAATRYKGKVHLWEIGNEPNDPNFWRPKVDVGRYGQWYTALDSVIRSVDSKNATAIGGLTALPVWYGDDGMSGADFLQALYDRGVRPANVAIHPYSNKGQSPDLHIAGAQNFDDIQLIHDQMVRNGQGSAGLWVTEWGWNTRVVSEADQADFLQRSLNLIPSKYPYVTMAIAFTQYDSGVSSYGMLRVDGTSKPAADKFRTFLVK